MTARIQKSPTNGFATAAMNADVIISVCAPTRSCFVTADAAIRTCAAHTDANIIVVANNMPVPLFRDALYATSQALGVKWYPYDVTPLNIATLFNEVFRATSGRYYVGAQQDVIFYDKWLANLIDAWESEPDYFMLAPYSFNLHRKDATCSLPRSPRSGILEAWPHGMAALAFRRDRPFYYDDNLATECDSDLYHYCRANKLRTGIVLNARVDHLEYSTVMAELQDWTTIMGNPNQRKDDAKKLKEKWNL